MSVYESCSWLFLSWVELGVNFMIITNSPVIIFLICNIIKCFKLQTAKQCHFFFFLEMVLIPVSLSPSVTNLRPQFIRHSVYQIQSLKSIFHFHCVIIRDFIQIIPEWSSDFPSFINLHMKLEIGVNVLSHSQLPVLFLLTVQSFSIFVCKEYN